MAQFVNEKILDRLTIEYEPPDMKFIADEILTEVPVTLEAGKYAIFQKFSSKIIDDTVGVKSETGRLEINRIKIDGTYATVERGLKDLITAKEAKVYADFTDLVADSVYGLKKTMMINREKLVADLVNASANFTSPSTKWNDANPTIEKDIRDAISAFENIAGRRPNVFVMPVQVWDVVNMDPTLREIWKLVPGRDDQSIKLSNLLKLLFDNFEMVLIPNAKYDAAKKGKDESLDYIWTDNCALLYVKSGRGTPKTFTWAAKFVKQDWKTKQWANIDPEGTWVKVYREDDVKVVCSAACYLLKDCLS